MPSSHERQNLSDWTLNILLLLCLSFISISTSLQTSCGKTELALLTISTRTFPYIRMRFIFNGFLIFNTFSTLARYLFALYFGFFCWWDAENGSQEFAVVSPRPKCLRFGSFSAMFMFRQYHTLQRWCKVVKNKALILLRTAQAKYPIGGVSGFLHSQVNPTLGFKLHSSPYVLIRKSVRNPGENISA